MQKKHKMTGCARLFLVLLILAPLAYLGAAYYNGQDGIQNIKNLLGIGSQTESNSNDTYRDTAKDLQNDVSEKDKEIRKLNDAIDELKKENQALKEEIEKLKKQGDISQ